MSTVPSVQGRAQSGGEPATAYSRPPCSCPQPYLAQTPGQTQERWRALQTPSWRPPRTQRRACCLQPQNRLQQPSRSLGNELRLTCVSGTRQLAQPTDRGACWLPTYTQAKPAVQKLTKGRGAAGPKGRSGLPKGRRRGGPEPSKCYSKGRQRGGSLGAQASPEQGLPATGGHACAQLCCSSCIPPGAEDAPNAGALAPNAGLLAAPKAGLLPGAPKGLLEAVVPKPVVPKAPPAGEEAPV